jgi:hypothetical protein
MHEAVDIHCSGAMGELFGMRALLLRFCTPSCSAANPTSHVMRWRPDWLAGAAGFEPPHFRIGIRQVL